MTCISESTSLHSVKVASEGGINFDKRKTAILRRSHAVSRRFRYNRCFLFAPKRDRKEDMLKLKHQVVHEREGGR